MKHLNLELEKLEQRIAPGGISTDGCDGSKDGGSKEHQKGNNGFGNGGDDPCPGGSCKTGDDKLADVVR